MRIWPFVVSPWHNAIRINAQQIAVVCKVMDRAQGNAVDDCGVAARISLVDDVCGFQQTRFTEATDRAAGPVGTQDGSSKAVLVQPYERLVGGVATDILV